MSTTLSDFPQFQQYPVRSEGKYREICEQYFSDLFSV